MPFHTYCHLVCLDWNNITTDVHPCAWILLCNITSHRICIYRRTLRFIRICIHDPSVKRSEYVKSCTLEKHISVSNNVARDFLVKLIHLHYNYKHSYYARASLSWKLKFDTKFSTKNVLIFQDKTYSCYILFQKIILVIDTI